MVDGRRLGGTWTLDRVWERLGIGAAIRRAAEGCRLDGVAVERVVFALVARRALEPGSKLAATKWTAERVVVDGLTGFTDDQAYRAVDFLLDALNDIAGEVFASVAHGPGSCRRRPGVKRRRQAARSAGQVKRDRGQHQPRRVGLERPGGQMRQRPWPR